MSQEERREYEKEVWENDLQEEVDEDVEEMYRREETDADQASNDAYETTGF